MIQNRRRFSRGFVRFSLATLMLACIFAGAVIGCVIHALKPNPWVRIQSIELSPEFYGGFGVGHTPILVFNHRGDEIAFANTTVNAAQFYDVATGKLRATKELPADACKNATYLTGRYDADDRDFKFAYLPFNEWQIPGQVEALKIPLLDGQDSVTWLNPMSQHAYDTKDPATWGKLLNPHGQYFRTDGLCQRVFWMSGSFAPDGAHYAVSNDRNCVNVYDTKTGDIVDQFRWTGQGTRVVRYSYDGRKIAAVSRDALTIWQREREPGWAGLWPLPIAWIGILSGMSLAAIFMRFVGKRVCIPAPKPRLT